jgi:hypothetical protein
LLLPLGHLPLFVGARHLALGLLLLQLLQLVLLLGALLAPFWYSRSCSSRSDLF